MKLYILGSNSGLEPIPGRKHTSFVLETERGIYWFGAGGTCSYTAHNMGLDLLSTQKIIISHPHMDHVGGLANLLWTLRKLSYVKNQTIDNPVEVWIPNKLTYDGIMQILSQTEGGFKINFELVRKQVEDGVLFDDGYVKVSAMHNMHLSKQLDGMWQSFSFKIEAEGKTIVYSGDCKSPEELLPLLPSDLLLMETGHHDPEQVAECFAENGYKGLLLIVHLGRDVVIAPDKHLMLAKNKYNNTRIASDGDILISGLDF